MITIEHSLSVIERLLKQVLWSLLLCSLLHKHSSMNKVHIHLTGFF